MTTVKRKRGNEITSPTKDRNFLNPELVSKHLNCSICQEVFIQPMRAPCGHSFCRKCIMVWLQNSNTCPEDRKPLDLGQLHHDFIVENIIGDHMVACSHRLLGCDAITPLHLLSSHIKSCDFNPDNQPEFLRRHMKSSMRKVSETVVSATACSSTATTQDGLSPSEPPSLIMRLYASGSGKKDLLKTMFKKE